MIKPLAPMAILIACFFEIEAQTTNELKLLSPFNYEKNIIYKIIEGDTLDMILFSPTVKNGQKSPVMLYTHGGGWGGGSKYNILKKCFFNTLKFLTDNGIACATIEYRLTRIGKSTAYDCVTDCKDAARFLMKNAEKYSLDVNRMGVWGGSAGGHLSLMTALGNNKNFIGDESLSGYNPQFACVASYFPLTSFIKTEFLKVRGFENPDRFIPILGGLLSEKWDIAISLSPAELLKKDSPPILLLHGDKDVTLPIEQSLYLVEVAKTVGANVKLLTVKNAGHSFNGTNISPTMDQINRISADFIIENLTTRKGQNY